MIYKPSDVYDAVGIVQTRLNAKPIPLRQLLQAAGLPYASAHHVVSLLVNEAARRDETIVWHAAWLDHPDGPQGDYVGSTDFRWVLQHVQPYDLVILLTTDKQ